MMISYCQVRTLYTINPFLFKLFEYEFVFVLCIHVATKRERHNKLVIYYKIHSRPAIIVFVVHVPYHDPYCQCRTA